LRRSANRSTAYHGMGQRAGFLGRLQEGCRAYLAAPGFKLIRGRSGCGEPRFPLARKCWGLDVFAAMPQIWGRCCLDLGPDLVLALDAPRIAPGYRLRTGLGRASDPAQDRLGTASGPAPGCSLYRPRTRLRIETGGTPAQVPGCSSCPAWPSSAVKLKAPGCRQGSRSEVRARFRRIPERTPRTSREQP
jgi:hypothetical protein